MSDNRVLKAVVHVGVDLVGVDGQEVNFGRELVVFPIDPATFVHVITRLLTENAANVAPTIIQSLTRYIDGMPLAEIQKLMDKEAMEQWGDVG